MKVKVHGEWRELPQWEEPAREPGVHLVDCDRFGQRLKSGDELYVAYVRQLDDDVSTTSGDVTRVTRETSSDQNLGQVGKMVTSAIPGVTSAQASRNVWRSTRISFPKHFRKDSRLKED